MSSVLAATLLSAGRSLLKEAKEAASAPSERPVGWELLGTYNVLSGPADGIYRVAIPADNPLRLRHGDTDIVVPYAELYTDFGSIPRWCKAVAESLHFNALHLPPDAYPRSTLLHDSLYAAAWVWTVHDGKALRVAIPRGAADAALMIALKCEGATRADVLAYSAAVKQFGGIAWSRHRENPPDFPILFATTNPTNQPEEQ